MGRISELHDVTASNLRPEHTRELGTFTVWASKTCWARLLRLDRQQCRRGQLNVELYDQIGQAVHWWDTRRTF